MTNKQLKSIRRKKNIRKRHNVKTNNVPKHLRSIPSAVDSYMH